MVLYGCVRCSISVPWLPSSIWTARAIYGGTFGRTKIPWPAFLVDVFEVVWCFAELLHRCWRWFEVLVWCFPFPGVFPLGVSLVMNFSLCIFISWSIFFPLSLTFSGLDGSRGVLEMLIFLVAWCNFSFLGCGCRSF